MHLTIQNIHSLSSGDFLMQLHSCFWQIKQDSGEAKTNRRIVKITVFTSCVDNTDYLQKMNLLNETLSQFEEYQSPVSLVSQPPLESKTLMEVWFWDYTASEPAFTFRKDDQSSFLQIDCPDFSCLISTHFSARHEYFKDNTHETFKLLDSTLRELGFDYSEIVRQWNYIENIVLRDDGCQNCLQDYQVFNDLRSLFYENSRFTNGYPSATGIGTANGGCTIEVIALKEKKRNSVKPLTNSLQVDAHSYSSNVLVGKAIQEIKELSTPKFERGKFMQFGDDSFLFISGTASIIGEKTVFPEDVVKQTLTTLRNIDHLVSMDNLNNNNISVVSQPRLLNYRVYLKNESDYSVVKPMCDIYFGINKGSFVTADICRSNLLVEIEANYCV